MTVSEIKQIAAGLGLHPSKGKGQHFLIQPGVVEKIIAACRLTRHETVLEVGSGFGILTEKLIPQSKAVTVVELDRRLVIWLQEHLASEPRLEIINKDILEYTPSTQFDILVTNLPYSISGAFFRHVLNWRYLPKRMIVMIQREVAERICAKPPDMNLLALSVQIVAAPKILFRVAAGNFWPSPKVESTVVEFMIQERPADYKEIMRIAKAGFAHPRRKLASNLAFGLSIPPSRVVMDLGDLGYDDNVRPQELGIDDWAALARILTLSTS